MFQPKFDDQSGRRASKPFSQLAFVVSEPAAARSDTSRADRNNARQANGDDENQWLHDRLTACYND